MYFTQAYLDFFKKLAAHQDRNWFNEHKKEYEKDVKQPFEHFVTSILALIKKEDAEIEVQAKDAIFRIHRDVRFSNDKSPYKLYASAMLTGHRKEFSKAGIYIEFGVENVHIYGGCYQPDKAQIHKIRTAIQEKTTEFTEILTAKDFVSKYGTIRGEANKIIPTEFKSTFQKQPLIAQKQFYFMAELPAEIVLDDALMDIMMEYWRTAQPINNFFNNALK